MSKKFEHDTMRKQTINWWCQKNAASFRQDEITKQKQVWNTNSSFQSERVKKCTPWYWNQRRSRTAAIYVKGAAQKWMIDKKQNISQNFWLNMKLSIWTLLEEFKAVEIQNYECEKTTKKTMILALFGIFGPKTLCLGKNQKFLTGKTLSG